MTVEELLAAHGVDLAALDPAPAKPDRAQRRARYALHLELPCTACGKEEDTRTSRVIDLPEAGPRWVDLCREHSLATMAPWRGPSTLEGVLKDFREVVAEVAAERGVDIPLRLWTDEKGWRDEPRG